jgi:drug/metabolite transporter (DMT)-like permease
VQLPWYVFAIGAAVVWGLHYPLIDHALKRVSPVSVLLLTALPILLVVPFFPRELNADLQAFRAMRAADRAWLLAIALTSLAGTVLLYLSIRERNATLASLIEISYPVFVVIFAWLLFREWHLNTGVLAGAALVFLGTALIIMNGR